MLTSEEELAAWLMPTRIDAKIGGTCAYNLPDPFGGTITELEPARLLHVAQEGDAYLRWEIADDGEVSFTDRMCGSEAPPGGDEGTTAYQPGGPGTNWAGVAAGWHDFLDRLAAYADGSPMPADEEYPRLVERYVEVLRRRFEG